MYLRIYYIMKNKYLNLLIIIINIIMFIEIILNNKIIYTTINTSIDIWLHTLIPSLFPFFIISDILIDYNIIYYIPNKIKYLLCKLFNITNSGLTVLLLSILSGFPSNARNTRTLYDKKLITKEEANHILMFTHFSNPLFILTTVGTIFLNNYELGVVILISHYLSNFILGLLLKNSYQISKNINNTIKKDIPNIGTSITNSIKHALDTLFLIFGTLTIFLIISSIIINRLNLNNYNSMLLKGLLEITMGIKDLSMLNLSPLYKVIISTILISFGGLSVHMQVISQIINTNIKYKFFFRGRIYGTIISGILSFVLYYIII